MVLKELIFNSFTLGGCGGPWKNSFLTGIYFVVVLQRTDFSVSNKNSFLTVSTLGSCGGLKRTQFLLWEGAVVFERTDF